METVKLSQKEFEAILDIKGVAAYEGFVGKKVDYSEDASNPRWLRLTYGKFDKDGNADITWEIIEADGFTLPFPVNPYLSPVEQKLMDRLSQLEAKLNGTQTGA